MTLLGCMVRGLTVVAGAAVGLAVLAGPAAADGTLSNDEQAMLALMDPSDRARYVLQARIQEQAEMAALLTQLQSHRHEAALSVINNVR